MKRVVSKLKRHKKLILTIALMKISIITLLYLLLFAVPIPAIDVLDDYEYIKGAHRGDSIKYKENTLEAISAAVESPEYAFVEFDVQYTKDKKRIVYHDGNLFRMEGLTNNVRKLNYKKLQSLTHVEIPLYKDVMDIIGDKKKINIEIKSQGNFKEDKELLHFIVKDITERGVRKNVLISSVSGDIVKYSKKKYPDIKTGKVDWIIPSTYLPFDFTTKKLYENIEELDADYVMLYSANIYNINDLIEQKPKDKILVFWYLRTDEMYIMKIDETDTIW